jgi:hypothetical protein
MISAVSASTGGLRMYPPMDKGEHCPLFTPHPEPHPLPFFAHLYAQGSWAEKGGWAEKEAPFLVGFQLTLIDGKDPQEPRCEGRQAVMFLSSCLCFQASLRMVAQQLSLQSFFSLFLFFIYLHVYTFYCTTSYSFICREVTACFASM